MLLNGWFVVLFALLILIQNSDGSEQKIKARKTKQGFSSGIKSNKISRSSNAAVLQSSPKMELLPIIINDVKDELIDIWDSLAYANSKEERLKNAVSIYNRHKTTLGAVGGIVATAAFIKFLTAKRGKELGMDYLGEMRKKEMEKWGRRNTLGR
eukprot:gene9115-18883_t